MPQPTITRFPIKVFHTTGSNKATPDSGLPPNQSMYPGGTFQDGRRPSIKRSDRAKRLYGEAGFAGRIHSHTYTSRIKTFPSVRKRRHHLSIQIAKFRIKCSPKNFFQNTALCHRTVKKTGNPFGILLGRHLSAIKGRKGFGTNNKDGNTPPRVLRICDKPEEKHADSIPCTGISGVSIQHQNHEDQGARTERQEAHTKNQTGTFAHDTILPLDGRTPGEDHRYVTCGGRSLVTHSPPTEELSDQPNSKELQLGKPMTIIHTSNGGAQVVEAVYNQEERLTHTQNSIEETQDHYHHGQLGHRLGDQFSNDADIWLLDRGRKATVNQRKRADEHLFCTEITWPKLPKFHNKGFDRQQNFNQVHNKSRRHSISAPTRLCSEDSGHLQQVQDTAGNISTYSRDIQHDSRSIVADKETIVREYNTKEVLQPDPTHLGASQSGYVCHPAEQTTTKVLESSTRPTSRCDGCLPTDLETNRHVCISSMETNTVSIATSQTEKDQADSTGDTLVAHSILVSDAVGYAPTKQTNILSTEREDHSSRMAIIRRAHAKDGLSETAMDYLIGAQRISTQKAYDNGWHLWVTWCKKNKVSFEEYNVQNVLNFLIANKNFSVQHLNTIRSSIASVFKYVHPDQQPIATQPLIQDFFNSRRKRSVKIPEEHELKTWDTDLVIQYIHTNLPNNTEISLTALQQKTIILLCIATMARPRSDIGNL